MARRPQLPIEAIIQLHGMIIDLRLDRAALLSGLSPAFVASMPSCPTVAGQVLADLHTLNDTPYLNNGSDPLLRYLYNASTLARPHESVRRRIDEILRG